MAKYAPTPIASTIAATAASFGFKFERRTLLPIEAAGLELAESGAGPVVIRREPRRGLSGGLRPDRPRARIAQSMCAELADRFRAACADVYGKSLDVHRR